MIKKITILLVVTAIFTGCVSGTNVLMQKPAKGVAEDLFIGKTIGVEPFEVDFTASRFALDLRDVTITVNGQEVELDRTYITKVDDEKIGYLGILEINPLEMTKANKKLVLEKTMAEMLAGLKGDADYHRAFFNGFGEGNMGYISNVPIDYDPNSWPQEISYLPPTGPTSYFTEVRDLRTESSGGVDYILKATVDISNEVVEILDLPSEEQQEDMMMKGERIPQIGEYYLLITSYFFWEIIDANTGEVVLDYRADGGYFINDKTDTSILLPVSNGDAAAFKNFFQTEDLTPYALDETLKTMSLYYHYMAPFYTNYMVFVPDAE